MFDHVLLYFTLLKVSKAKILRCLLGKERELNGPTGSGLVLAIKSGSDFMVIKSELYIRC